MSTHVALRVEMKFLTDKETKMKAQEQIKNDESNLRADTLTDLPVSDEQADRATGGTRNQGKLLVGVDNIQVR
jgi:hypothetical protein